MKIFSFLTKLFPIGKLLLIVKWLKTQKGWVYPIVGVKIFNFFISFLLKAEKIRFIAIVKYLYYFLSAFNAVLALILITNFSDLNNPELVKFFLTSLEVLIPVILLEGLSEYIEEMVLFFKNMIKNFIDWVYSRDKESDKSHTKSDISPKIPSQDQFSYKAFDLELDDSGNPLIEEEQRNSLLSIVFITIAILGLSYSLHPELFHNIYSNLKDLFFPRGGGDTGGTIIHHLDTPSLTTIQHATDRVVYDNTLTNLQKINRISSLSKAILHEGHNYSPEENLDRVDLLDQAVKLIVSGNTTIDVTHIASSSTSLPPSNITTSLPHNSSSTSTGSLTPTNNVTPLPSQSPSNLNLQIPVASTPADLINLDNSPVLERVPNNLDWTAKGGGRLRGMFSTSTSGTSSLGTTPIVENNTPIPIPSKPIDLDEMMDKFK